MLTIPSTSQMEWKNAEIGVIIHCDIEICQPTWQAFVNGHPNKPPSIDAFNPTQLNTDQWIKSAKAAGATYAVLTAKHITGFTLFPDKDYDYAIDKTPFRNGNGNIVSDFIASCKKYGLKPGIYYSCEANFHLGIHKGSGHLPKYPSNEWDTFQALVTRHLTHLWSQYGDLFEIWFDGGLLENGPDYIGLLTRYQPNANCFQGPIGAKSRIRWVGNESGLAPYPCWATIQKKKHNFDGTEENKELGHGDPNGEEWMPAEVDVPLRFLQWFWIPNQDSSVAPPEVIMRWYYQSVGRNTNLLLGLVIDNRGLVPDFDVSQLDQFGQLLKSRFENPLGSTSGKGTFIQMDLGAEKKFNTIVIQEDIAGGHRVRQFIIEISSDKTKSVWSEIYKGSAIGHKLIVEIPDQKAQYIRLRINESVLEAQISTFKIYDLAHLDWD